MKKLLALVLVAVMALSMVAYAEPAIEGDYLVATGSATGNYYAFGSAMCGILTSKTGASLTVQASGGSTENARMLGSGETEFALIQTDVYSYAQNGVELFDGNAITNFQAITTCYPEMVQIVVRKAAGIQSVADLKGKNICPGAVGSGYEVAARQILGAYGLTYDDMNVTFADQATAKNGIQDGTFDAMFMCSGFPNNNVVELSLTGKIDVLSIDAEHMAILLEQYPFYAEFTPATAKEDYSLDHELTSVAVKSMLVCVDTFSEDEIYALTKALYENLDELKEINGKAKAYMTVEGALSGIPSNLHPGARRYYEEIGLEIPDYLK
ncbi:MAG: TAXI family TRAP transporter solute-binding subunit [Clostridia bacterium]|nr:TAXI family TRAP transporter solute-binding subunit [Clostridia bacterium]